MDRNISLRDLKTDINENAISYSFTSSSGPGGQNVNRVSTAVQLRLNLDDIVIDEDIKRRLIALSGSRYTKSNEILISASSYRTQKKNRDDALDRLISLFKRAEIVPKKRKKVKISRAAKERRLKSKKKHSLKKANRRKADY